mgnify:CR=1 FL=1
MSGQSATIPSRTILTSSYAPAILPSLKFALFANGIEDSFHFAVEKIFEANRAFSQSITTSLIEENEALPFFAVPYFEVKAASARHQASFEVVTYAPIVTAKQLTRYLEFSNQTRGWIDDSKRLYDTLEPGKNRSAEAPIPPLPLQLWKPTSDGGYEIDEGSSIMVPSLHISPPPVEQEASASPVYQNVNLWSDPDYKDVTLASLSLKDAVFSKFDESYALYSSKVTGEAYDYIDVFPHSIAAQPVFEALQAPSSSRSGLKVAGYIYSVIDWTVHLHNLLPEGVNGIIVVLRNSCDQSYTYELNGNQATLLAKGDIHNPSFNRQGKVIDFANFYFDPNLTSTQEGHCQIFLNVYPSDTFVDAYNSNLSKSFAIMVAALFIIMALIFMLYDWVVSTRNYKVVGAAARTNSIVSSLFPDQVKERLIAEHEEEDGRGKQQNLKRFLVANVHKGEVGSTRVNGTKPLADLYPGM